MPSSRINFVSFSSLFFVPFVITVILFAFFPKYFSSIQAGSVVVSDIEPCSIAGGHPAKVFKMRNEQHYYELKSENKFF